MSLRDSLRSIVGSPRADDAPLAPEPGAITAEAVATALRQHEFNMHFQPVIDLESGELMGAEALLRWEQPGSPDVATARQFMSKAVGAGVLSEMSESLVGPACEFARDFQVPGKPIFSLGVNLSSTQLTDSVAAVASVREALATSELPPWCLLLEIPEHALLGGAPDLPLTIERLARMGVGIVIDDFWGSERPDELLATPGLRGVKLDVRSNTNSDVTRAQLHVAARLAHERGLTVTAKRVESNFEIEFARELHCDMVQGHAYGRPMTAQAFRAFALGMVDGVAESVAQPPAGEDRLAS